MGIKGGERVFVGSCLDFVWLNIMEGKVRCADCVV